jgi:hypothetical protein
VRKREARENKRRETAEKTGFATETRRHRELERFLNALEGDTPGQLRWLSKQRRCEKRDL